MPVALEVWKSKQEKRTDWGGGFPFDKYPRFAQMMVTALEQTFAKIIQKLIPF